MKLFMKLVAIYNFSHEKFSYEKYISASAFCPGINSIMAKDSSVNALEWAFQHKARSRDHPQLLSAIKDKMPPCAVINFGHLNPEPPECC